MEVQQQEQQNTDSLPRPISLTAAGNIITVKRVLCRALLSDRMMDGEAGSAPESFSIFRRHTFLQEPVVGGVSGSSLERRLPVGTPGVVGLRFARNGDEKRT